MPKVTGPLFSLKATGQFAKSLIFKRGGIVVNYFIPRNPNSAAQQAQREAFRSLYVAGLTQEQADLLYSAIAHLHDDRYSQLSHDHAGVYSPVGHDHAGVYSPVGHDHAGVYSPIGYGLSALSANFTLTGNAGVFQDTGLSVSLPVAGTYDLFADVRGLIRGNAGTNWWITCKLYNSTDGADVANSERMMCVWYVTNVYVQGTTTINIRVTVTDAKTIKLYACRNGSTSPTWSNSQILTGAEGRTVLGYRRVE